MHRLVLVYNADSGLFGQVTDFAHKILRPQTYACNLCKLTYGAFSMKREWKDFLETLGTEVEFLHKDEFLEKYPDTHISCFPVVCSLEAGAPKVMLSCEEINQARTVEDLKVLLMNSLQNQS